ncbi:MAG: hypothetical protein ACK4WJ_06615, partial [Endomicrobiia bacterium]
MNILEKILNSEKIHLTQSEKIFIKETFEILSIFSDKIEKIFWHKYNEVINYKNNKFDAGKKFFLSIQNLRYPVSFNKIQKIKKFLTHKKVGFSNLEFNENELFNNH